MPAIIKSGVGRSLNLTRVNPNPKVAKENSNMWRKQAMRRMQNTQTDSKYKVGRQEVWRRKASSWRKPTDFASFKDRRGTEIKRSWREAEEQKDETASQPLVVEEVAQPKLCALAPAFVPQAIKEEKEASKPRAVCQPTPTPVAVVAPILVVAPKPEPIPVRAVPKTVQFETVNKPLDATEPEVAYTIWFAFFVAMLSIATGMYAATNAEEGFKLAMFTKITIFEVALLSFVYPMVRSFAKRHTVKTVENFGKEETIEVR